MLGPGIRPLGILTRDSPRLAEVRRGAFSIVLVGNHIAEYLRLEVAPP